MQRPKRAQRDALPVVLRRQELRRKSGEAILVLTQELRRSAGGGEKIGVGSRQHREHPVPDAVAAEIVGGVAAVLHPGDAALREIGDDLLMCHAQQRTHKPSALRRDAAESLRPAPACEVEQHGLGIVGGVVRRGDDGAARAFGRLLEEAVAQFARGLLQPHAMLRRVSAHVPTPDDEFNARVAAEGGNKALIPLRLFPAQAVIVMRGDDGIPAAAQQIQQTHGIRPAGESAEQLRPGREQRAIPIRNPRHSAFRSA